MTRYKTENTRLWARLRQAAEQMETDLRGLDELLCLADGTLELMERYGLTPEGELLTRIRRFLGMTSHEILFDRESENALETPKTIRVFNGSPEQWDDARGSMLIDRSERDDREYVGLIVRDNSMSRIGLLAGDVVVIRRQAVAEDGDIVAAEANGLTVVRRFCRRGALAWLEADGYVGEEPDVSSLGGSANVKIWGKVISSVRLYEQE